MKLHGVDFTSAPSRHKGITIASGCMQADVLRLESLQTLSDFAAFDNWLIQPGPWLAGFDLPFSLPRELVEHLRWPANWPDLMRHLQTQTRAELRLQFKAFCDARAVGNKFAHRATDIPAGSSPSMKWVNPPVANMLHAGAPRLLDARVSIPGMHEGDPQRIALEAYPGMVARSITKASYKSDVKDKQTLERRQAREHILQALKAGSTPWKIKLHAGNFGDALLSDGSADLLDAVLCMVLAAWAHDRRGQNFGLPEFDPLEGWIVGS